MDVRVHTLRLGSFDELDKNRGQPVHVFARQVMDSEPSLGRFLDIGCGPGLQPPLQPIATKVAEFHGVDPSEEVQQHPLAVRKFQGAFETMQELPRNYYNTALAYNVLEHIVSARAFFQQVHTVLAPGGSFWALTPHARHPFAILANLVRYASLKKLYIDLKKEGVNDYPSYYRLNSPASVTKAIDGLGYRSADFYMIPNVQWDQYVPRALRFMPHMYDRAIGSRVGGTMLLMTMRLVKA